ncbi:MAG: PAS domain S-box protein [Desulfatirhabdiaceae bacterium]
MGKMQTYEELEKQVHALQIENDEMRRANQAISESEAFHRLTLENISDTVVITDDHGKIVYACPNAGTIFGLSQNQIYAKGTIQELIHGKAWEVSELGREKEIRNIEWTVRDTSGRERFVLITVKSVSIRGGTVLYVIRDITEKIKSDENLRRYKNIVSSTADGIALIDENYQYVLVNDSYERFSGAKREKFIGKTVSEYSGQEIFEECIKPNFDRCLKGEVVNYQEWFAYPGLGRRFVDVTYYPYHDSENSICGVICNTRDITDLKRLEVLHQEMKARTEAILSGIMDTFYSLDNQWRFTLINPAAEKAPFNRPAAELIGHVIWDLYPDLVGTDIHGHYLRAAEKYSLEHYEAQSPLNSRWYEVFIHGWHGGVDVYMRDITERKQNEFEREQTIRMLEILHTKTDIRGLMKSLLRLMQELSGCMAVGIRLRDGDDFPYYETSGFPDDFVTAEKHLCAKDLHGQLMRDEVGNPILECMCGNIICGRFDPSKPFFTEFGSFISNNTSQLLSSTTEEDRQARTRNRCNGEGCESVFLIPLRSGGETFGLLQFNDFRAECFSPRIISQAEGMARNVAIALAQRRAEEELRESRERYRTILQTAMDGFWLTDVNGYLMEVNAAYCSMSGYTESELLGRHISDLEGLENFHLVSEHMQRVISRGADRFESLHRRKNGTVFDVEVSIQHRPEDGGLCICFIRDISQQKQMENALRRSEALFRNLINSAPEGIFVQAAGRFLFLNPAMVQIFGAGSAAELIGTDLMARIAPEHHDAVRNRIQIQTETGKPVPLMDQVYLRVDGSRISVETTAVAIQYNGHGAHLVFVRDITARKKQEETLRLQALVLDQICDIVTITDMDGVISYVNQAQTKVLGYSKESLIGQPTQIFGEDPFQRVSQKEIVENTVKNGFWRGEVIHYDLSGQAHILDCRTQVVFDRQGKPMALCGIATDVTDYKRSEKALLESEVKFRTLVDQAPAALFLHDMDGNIVDVNRAASKGYGYPTEQLLKMKANDIDPDYIERENKGLFRERPKEKQRIKFEGRHRRSDGSIFPVSVSMSPIVLNGKNHIITLAIDMTEYKNAREKLMESEERFRTVFEQAAVGVAGVSLDGGFLEINDQFCQLVGYEKQELFQMTFRDITHPDDLYLDEKYIEQVLAGKIDSFDIEKRYIHKDGHPVWVRLYSNVVRNAGGKIKYAVAVVTDISERKRAEQEKEKLQNQLNHAQKLESIGNLAGGIAHDFNNILFPIVGMSEMLLDDLPPGSPERESAEEIYKAGKRGRDLVKQILAFSRQSEHKLIPTRIQNVFKEVLKLSRAFIPSYIEIDHNIQQDCGMIMADPSQIHQIGMNIITNAFHAVEAKGGKISVRLRETVLDSSDPAIGNMESGKYAVLSISDTGHGMPEELIGKIFDPYFTTKEQGKGTGLGLAVVYGIVKEHGGAITVNSEIGKGATFEIYFPLMKKSFGSESSLEADEYHGGNERILLVDDEESIAKLEKQMLERMGYKVISHLHSVEALEAFRVNPSSYDLVITDMSMPNIPGDELARKIKSIRSDAPIIVCTGYSERIHVDNIKQMGIDELLMKPIVKSDLVKVVRKVLDAKAKNQG